MTESKAPATYRSGPRKGLPKRCECGGEMEYDFDMGRVWSGCKICTPVVRVDMWVLRHRPESEPPNAP